MGGTGIVRRMDELGRIVIPKEIRRAMRLAEGDEVEIFPDGEGFAVRRHSRFSGFRRAAERAVTMLAEASGCEVFLVAADRVAAASGTLCRSLLSRPVTEELREMARERAAGRRTVEGGIVPVGGVRLAAEELFYVPVACGGDVAGCLFFAGKGARDAEHLALFAAGMLEAVCGE